MNYPPLVNKPSLQQLLWWIANPLGYLDTWSKQYGDCFVGQLGDYRNFVFFSNPDAIAQLFTADSALFETGKANQILRPTLGDNSVLLLDGDRHQRQRQLLMPPFHGERMKAYGQIICDVTAKVTHQWQPNIPFIARSAMQSISLQVILQAVFGLSDSPRFQQLRQLLDELLTFTTSQFWFGLAFFPWLHRDLGAWSPWGRFVRLRQQIDDLIYAEIRDRQGQTEERTDILSLLLAARDEAGQPMTEVELRDELITLLIAGHETTATALTWALYWLHSQPTTKAKLLAELDSLGDQPDPMAIARLPYLNAVCAETLRIYPVAFIAAPRVPLEPVHIAGYDFEPGTFLVPCIYLTHHRADLYPDSKEFQPERFIERQFSPYEFLPFGGSNRRCIGAAFALFEMKLALATILRQYELALIEPTPATPIRRGVTMAPKGGVPMIMTRERAKTESKELKVS